MATTPTSAPATRSQEREYVVVVDGITLASGKPDKHQAVRVGYGETISLVPGSDQTRRLLAARSIVAKKPGAKYDRRVNIATIAKGYGAEDAVAKNSKVVAEAAAEPDENESKDLLDAQGAAFSSSADEDEPKE